MQLDLSPASAKRRRPCKDRQVRQNNHVGDDRVQLDHESRQVCTRADCSVSVNAHGNGSLESPTENDVSSKPSSCKRVLLKPATKHHACFRPGGACKSNCSNRHARRAHKHPRRQKQVIPAFEVPRPLQLAFCIEIFCGAAGLSKRVCQHVGLTL